MNKLKKEDLKKIVKELAKTFGVEEKVILKRLKEEELLKEKK